MTCRKCTREFERLIDNQMNKHEIANKELDKLDNDKDRHNWADGYTWALGLLRAKIRELK